MEMLKNIDVHAETDLLWQVLDACHAPIVITDHKAPDEPIIYCNAAFEKISGYTRDEIIGENCRFLQGEETDTEHVAHIRESLEKGEACAVTIQNYTKNGDMFWNELHLHPVKLHGEVTHFLGMQIPKS